MLNAVYPGTFDPLTNGHLDLIARASRIFPKVYVGVATSAGKHPLLSLEERLYCARLVCADFANVEPLPVTGLLKDFVRRGQSDRDDRLSGDRTFRDKQH